MKKIRFTIFDQPESNELGEYLCDSPGDLSGEYVRAEEAEKLLEYNQRLDAQWNLARREAAAIPELVELLKELQPAILCSIFGMPAEEAARWISKITATLAKHTKGPMP